MKRKKWFLLVLVFVVLLGGFLGIRHYLILTNFKEGALSPAQIKIKDQIVEKMSSFIQSQPEGKWVLTPYNDLIRSLNFRERIFVQSIFRRNPKKFGFDGPYYGGGTEPELVPMEGQRYFIGSDSFEISPQYVPRKVYQDLRAMLDHIKGDLGRSLLILSGWRSDGYQASLFLKQMKHYGNSITATLKAASFPGYSEHASPRRPAVDFLTEDAVAGSGSAGPALTTRAEYYWLLQWAGRYNFYLSYPREDGRHQFEPGHWHWESPSDRQNSNTFPLSN